MTGSHPHASAPAASADSPLDLLQQMIEAGGELESRNRLILERLEKDDVEGGRSLIADRAMHLVAFESLYRRFLRACPDWNAYLACAPPARRGAAGAATDRFNALLRDLGEGDRRIAERLQGCGEAISRSLAEISTVRRTHRAYSSGATASSAGSLHRFMDRRG